MYQPGETSNPDFANACSELESGSNSTSNPRAWTEPRESQVLHVVWNALQLGSGRTLAGSCGFVELHILGCGKIRRLHIMSAYIWSTDTI